MFVYNKIKNRSRNHFILILAVVFVLSFSLTLLAILYKHNFDNILERDIVYSKEEKQESKNIYKPNEQIIFGDKNLKLYFVEPIHNGLAMYYSSGNGASSMTKLIINQYGNLISAKDLSGGIVYQSKENSGETLSQFVAPDNKKREAYYITAKSATDYDGKNVTISVIKVFEDNGLTYSIIYQQKIEGSDKVDIKNKSDEWIIGNLERIGNFIDEVDLATIISL